MDKDFASQENSHLAKTNDAKEADAPNKVWSAPKIREIQSISSTATGPMLGSDGKTQGS